MQFSNLIAFTIIAFNKIIGGWLFTKPIHRTLRVDVRPGGNRSTGVNPPVDTPDVVSGTDLRLRTGFIGALGISQHAGNLKLRHRPKSVRAVWRATGGPWGVQDRLVYHLYVCLSV